MLTPEAMEEAGEFVAATYRQIEAELIEYLVAKMIEGDVAGQRVQTAILMLTQSMPLELKKIIDAHADEIEAAVKYDVERAMGAADAFDAAIITESLGMTLATEALTVQTATVLASAREMVARDNLALSEAARAKFLQWSTWAAAQTATGNMTVDRAMHKAVRELTRGGLSIPFVTYKDEKTGKTTVTNHADVAVQRHLRSLIGQGAAQLTFMRMEEANVEFVEVSSHIGARPSHCEWQGQCYHIGGDVKVDGVFYGDFEYGTGYRGTCGPYTALGDQLLGVNCRHSFAPYVPGSPRAYEPDPKSPTGLSNAEIYDLSQKQRYRERRIREAKRDLKGAQQLYDANPSPENAANVTKAKLLLQKRQKSMRDFIRESNAKCNPGTQVLVRQPIREWAGDMPKIATKGELRLVKPALSVEIDEFTPCVRKLSTDEIIQTTTRKIKPESIPNKSEWEFDWSKEKDIYALYADGDNRIQGLISLEDKIEDKAVFVDIAESAPHNNKHNPYVKGQEYSGVGAHLFAFAVKKSREKGYNGFVYFDAKTDLVDHYEKVLGAVQIGNTQRMFIPEEAAKVLYEKYYGNK